jgi:hypothetical protein
VKKVGRDATRYARGVLQYHELGAVCCVFEAYDHVVQGRKRQEGLDHPR